MTMLLLLVCSLVLSTIELSHCQCGNSTNTPITPRIKATADPERVEKHKALIKKLCENSKALTEKQVQVMEDCPLKPEQRKNTLLVECRKKVFGSLPLDERQTRICKGDAPGRLKEIEGQIHTCLKKDPVTQEILEDVKKMTKEEQVEFLINQKILAQKKREYQIAQINAMTPREQKENLNKQYDKKIACIEKATA